MAMGTPKARGTSFLVNLCLVTTSLLLISSSSFITPAHSAALLDSWRVVVQKGGVCAVHMTTAYTDKVIIYDRTNAGKSQISMPNGTCRDNPYDQSLPHDCTAHSTEYDSLTDAIRPLSIFSDPFCSSAAFLANGHLVQMGGDKEGNNTVRFIGPGPSDDWSETMNYLFVKRWYTTAQILPTGNIILVGGAFQNSYEFYPRSTTKPVTLPLLQKKSNENGTWNNWYPFVHLLPDGNLFIYANVYSQIFNYRTNKVVKDMPNFGMDPRTYPYSGSSVLLPLTAASNFTNVEIMVCGGGPLGSYTLGLQQNFTKALDTCGRIKPYDATPAWAVETMPGPRCMNDGLILPTGELLIINGVQNGIAGYNMARNPELSPWLYNFETRKFTVQSPTTIARVYHSSAVVQSDGAVLVGGANDQFQYRLPGSPGVRFPTELRLEKYSPYYLNSQFNSVRFSITGGRQLQPMRLNTTDYVVAFSSSTPPTSVQISLYAPSFTTHTNSMHQRMLVLRVIGNIATTSVGGVYNVKVASPPNANVAPPQWYMITALNTGVTPAIPSRASWVQVTP